MPTAVEVLNVLGIFLLLRFGAHRYARRLIVWAVRQARRTETNVDDYVFRTLLVFFPLAAIAGDEEADRHAHHQTVVTPRTRLRRSLPLTLRFAGEGVPHTLYGVEAFVYEGAVLLWALSSAALLGMSFTPEHGWEEFVQSTLFYSLLLRVVTPLQSVSALFVADIGRHVGHTVEELEEIRSALIILSRAARVVLWLGALVAIATHAGVDPMLALSGFGVGSLFVGLALRQSLEDAMAVISLLMSVPFRVGDFVHVQSRSIFGEVVKIGFRTTHIRTKFDGSLVQVPNTAIAGSAVENNSMYELRRAKVELQLAPVQSAAKLASVRKMVQKVFAQPAVADWQQYLPKGAAAAERKKGPTQLEEAFFTVRAPPCPPLPSLRDLNLGWLLRQEVNTHGALVFNVVFMTPSADVDSHKIVRHEAIMGIMRGLEQAGVECVYHGCG